MKQKTKENEWTKKKRTMRRKIINRKENNKWSKLKEQRKENRKIINEENWKEEINERK